MSGDALRLEKWLWFARFFKTRALATRACETHGVRVNGLLSHKPHASVRVGDVLTLLVHQRVRVVRVRALGLRRGPAPEARALYEDLAPADDGPAEVAVEPDARVC